MYLRLAPGQAWDEVPQALVEDCAQLTKANSIEGTTIISAAQGEFVKHYQTEEVKTCLERPSR